MDFLQEWITNIILFILLATVIDMLLPNSSLQKYVKVVIGLLLISIILSPIMKIFSSDFETVIASLSSFQSDEGNQNMENLIESQKIEIQATQDAYILEQTEYQLKVDAEKELMEQYGMEIVAIEITADEMVENASPESFQSISVEVINQGDVDEAVAVVKEVDINTAESPPSEQNFNSIEEISTLLSEKWNVSKTSIQVVIKGGT